MALKCLSMSATITRLFRQSRPLLAICRAVDPAKIHRKKTMFHPVPASGTIYLDEEDRPANRILGFTSGYDIEKDKDKGGDST